MSNDQKPATLDDVVAALQMNQETLDEVVCWLRIEGSEKVKKLLEGILDSTEKILMYHLSDGKSNKAIGEMCGVDPKTVSNNYRSWHRLGLMKSQSLQEGKYKYFKAFNVEDFGIKIPTITKQETKQKPDSEQTRVEQKTGNEENDEQ